MAEQKQVQREFVLRLRAERDAAMEIYRHNHCLAQCYDLQEFASRNIGISSDERKAKKPPLFIGVNGELKGAE